MNTYDPPGTARAQEFFKPVSRGHLSACPVSLPAPIMGTVKGTGDGNDF